jgi:hypothetical protein
LLAGHIIGGGETFSREGVLTLITTSSKDNLGIIMGGGAGVDMAGAGGSGDMAGKEGTGGGGTGAGACIDNKCTL